MKKLLGIYTFAALVLAPGFTVAQSSPSVIGSGPHAYDWAIGTWSCTNAAPGGKAAPANQVMATRSDTTNAIVLHFIGKDSDQYAFLSYEAPSRTWWVSSALPGGDISNESSTMAGKKTVAFNGSYFVAAKGTHFHIRDTITLASATKYIDQGADDSKGSMQTNNTSTCTKS